MEREFYMRLCIKEGYSKRELERQINSGYCERYMLSKEKLLPEPIKGLKEYCLCDSVYGGTVFCSADVFRKQPVAAAGNANYRSRR